MSQKAPVDAKESLPVAQPLKLRHCMTAGRTWLWAFQQDRFTRFVWDADAPPLGPIKSKIRECLFGALFALWIARKTVFTTAEGKTVGVSTYPSKTTLWTRLLDVGVQCVDYFIRKLQSQRGLKRAEVIHKRVREVLLKEFGDEKLKAMVNCHLLAAVPSVRGRGHASAIIRAGAKIADERKLSAWCLSVNIANTKLYEAFGFKTVAELVVAEDDKDWKEGPIPIRVMIREPEPLKKLD